MTTTQEEIYVIKRWPFDNASPQLTIHPNYISYQNTRIEKIDIMECRFGIRWLDGLKFTIGRDYQIFIRDKKNQVLKISFKTFYGINKKVLSEKFNDILDKLWDYYFSEIVSDYLNKFGDGEAVNISNVLNDRKRIAFFWEFSDVFLKGILLTFLLIGLVIATCFAYYFFSIAAFIISLGVYLMIMYGVMSLCGSLLEMYVYVLRQKNKPVGAFSLAIIALDALVDRGVTREYDSLTGTYSYYPNIVYSSGGDYGGGGGGGSYGGGGFGGGGAGGSW